MPLKTYFNLGGGLLFDGSTVVEGVCMWGGGASLLNLVGIMIPWSDRTFYVVYCILWTLSKGALDGVHPCLWYNKPRPWTPGPNLEGPVCDLFFVWVGMCTLSLGYDWSMSTWWYSITSSSAGGVNVRRLFEGTRFCHYLIMRYYGTREYSSRFSLVLIWWDWGLCI